MIVIVKEVLKVTANPMILDDIDKMVIVLDDGSGERRVVLPWEDFKTVEDFEKVLAKAVAIPKKEKEVINMSQDWKGEYNI